MRKLFERFCADTGMPCVRLEPGPAGRRTPDYELRLQEPPILVEVKQIDPNPEDEARLRAFADTGEYSFDGVPGDRLRGRISKAGSPTTGTRPTRPAYACRRLQQCGCSSWLYRSACGHVGDVWSVPSCHYDHSRSGRQDRFGRASARRRPQHDP